MAGSDSGARVTVKVLVKEHQVAPVRVGLELFEVAENWPVAVLVAQKGAGQPTRQFSCHLPQRHHLPRPGGALDFEVLSQIVMELLQRLDQQEIYREPNRSA